MTGAASTAFSSSHQKTPDVDVIYSGVYIFLFSLHLNYYPPTALALPSSSNSDPGSHIVAGPSPPPHYGTCLPFYREKTSQFSSLVDSRQSVRSTT